MQIGHFLTFGRFVILTIISSFTGLFIIFVTGDFYFDQGGYVALILTGGFVANSSIFIISDCKNIITVASKSSSDINDLISAVLIRSRTILLTTISTCCGLIPFLMEGQNEVFWFSFALGTIGGLCFSIISLFLILPVLIFKYKSKINIL